jgi:HK97 family phage prohead protease
MNRHTFILSDESINNNGQIVLTKGINIERFSKNPVMLYMHERNTVIGRWDNIRKEDGKLIADAFFDTSIEPAEDVKNQVENGILRAVSIGIDIMEIELINGIETIVSCELYEASIVDIPSNKNTVKLRYKTKKNDTGILIQIKALLGLSEDCANEGILSAIEELTGTKQSTTQKNVKKALEMRLITCSDMEHYSYMNNQGKKKFDSYCNNLINIDKDKVNQEVKKAMVSKKIIPYEMDIFHELGYEIGSEKLKKIFGCMVDRIKLSDTIPGGKDYNKSNWGLMEYRKYAPDELKDNPDLYRRLLEKDSHQTENTLDWYRRNNPDYLHNNPKEYERLLNIEKSKIYE